MALAVRAQSDGKDKSMVCSYCKQTEHEFENCFALIGYPKWWGDRPRSDGKGRRHDRTQPSGSGGHEGGRGGRGMTRACVAQDRDSTLGGAIGAERNNPATWIECRTVANTYRC